jgi:hypothetical protein
MSPGPIESEGAVEIHAPMLPGDRGWRLLRVSPFSHEVCQSLGLDHRLLDIDYVKPLELERPLYDPSHGKAVSNNFPEPI